MKRTVFSPILAVIVLLATASAQDQTGARRETGNFGTLTVATDDGRQQACELRSLEARVEVDGRFARTEVEQVFFNPLPRQSQGTFDFQLPPGAAINRLAMEIDGKLVEGEIVEREKARAVYDQIVRQMRDPAILEWQGGERFKTQVFPIPPKGEKRVVLSYLTRLPENDGVREYRYALPSLPEASAVGNFRIRMRLHGVDQATVTPYDAQVHKAGAVTEVAYEQSSFHPRGDFIVRLPVQSNPLAIEVGEAFGHKAFLLDVAPVFPASARSEPRDFILLADTSGSMRELAYAQLLEAASQILAALSPKDRFRVVAGDLKVHPLQDGFQPPAGAEKALAALKAIEPGGGTNLEALLLAGAVKPPEGRRTVAVYLGDGEPSLGELDGDLLSDHIHTAYRKAGAELHAVGLGASPSGDFLRRMARRSGGQYLGKEAGRALDLKSFLAALDLPLLSEPTIAFEGNCASRPMPDPLPNLAKGERLTVMGLFEKPGACKASLSGNIAGKPITLAYSLDFAKAQGSPLLPVFWARERIDHLEKIGGDRREIVELSKEAGIMCRYTSFLVLENEEAYKRFQIDRKQQQKQQAEAPAAPTGEKAPLTKAKLAEGQSISDFLKNEAAQPQAQNAPASPAAPSPTLAPGAVAAKEERADKDDEGMAEKKMMVRSQAGAPASEPESMEVAASPMAKPSRPSEDRRREGEGPAKTAAKHKGGASVATATPAKPPSPKEQIDSLRKALQEQPNNVGWRQNLVALLQQQNQGKEAREQVEKWIQEAGSDPNKLQVQVLPVLDQMPNDDWNRERRVQIAKVVLSSSSSSPEALVAFVDTMVRAGRAKEALEVIDQRREAAKKDTQSLLDLVPAYARLGSMPEARKALTELATALMKDRPLDTNLRWIHLEHLKEAGLKQDALAALKDWRRYAPDFPELVLEQVAMLRELGKPDEAERTLSELVEFNPHDFAARSQYAQILSEAGRPVEACGEYTRAVQLNPAQRDTFRTMMALRRAHPKAAEAIKKCIVDGVSRLPVIRDVSIVMLWEDPRADVDMHVVEPSGEEVWYSHLESASGGHLYYDVTDGFGPEIYVVGTGKPGTYRLGVVYYSGSQPLTGKFIVMRHAGGPEETRQEFPFSLKTANSSVTIPITTFAVGK